MRTYLDINKETEEKIELSNIQTGYNRAGQFCVHFETNFKYLDVHWGNNTTLEDDDGSLHEAHGLYLTAEGPDGHPITGAALWLIPDNQVELSAIDNCCAVVYPSKYEYHIALIPIRDMQPN